MRARPQGLFPSPKSGPCVYPVQKITVFVSSRQNLETPSIWKHLEGHGSKKWCHSEAKSYFKATCIKKSAVFEGVWLLAAAGGRRRWPGGGSAVAPAGQMQEMPGTMPRP